MQLPVEDSQRQRPLTQPTPVLLIVTLLIAQPDNQRAGLQPTVYNIAKLRLHAGNFCEKCHFLVTNDPFRHKTQQMFCTWNVAYASACKISPSYDTAFRWRYAPDKINKLSNI